MIKKKTQITGLRKLFSGKEIIAANETFLGVLDSLAEELSVQAKTLDTCKEYAQENIEWIDADAEYLLDQREAKELLVFPKRDVEAFEAYTRKTIKTYQDTLQRLGFGGDTSSPFSTLLGAEPPKGPLN